MNNNTKTSIQVFVLLFALTLSAAALAKDARSQTSSKDDVQQVNINKASAAELAFLPGIGPSTATRIVQYRTKQPFKKVQHLMRVKGIGRKTFAKLKPYIVVDGATTASKKIKLPKQ